MTENGMNSEILTETHAGDTAGVLNKLRKQWEARDKGEINFIPLYQIIPGLTDVMPALMSDDYLIITANTGVGKSRFMRYMLLNMVRLARQNNFKLKVYLNALEETKDSTLVNFMLSFLAQFHNIRLTKAQIMGYAPVLPSREQRIIIEEEGAQFIHELQQYIEIVQINNPTGFFKHIVRSEIPHGRFINTRNGEPKEVKPGAPGTTVHFDHYIPHDPTRRVIAVSDHIWFYSPEGKRSKKDTVDEIFSNYFCRQMLNNKMGISVINIQQQSGEAEKKVYHKGNAVLEKMTPSLDTMGDTRLVARDCTLALGLFAPSRYKAPSYYGYDINKLRDHFRSLHVLKARDGRSDKVIPMFFDGAANLFYQLPRSDTDKMETWYNHAAHLIASGRISKSD